VESAKAGTAAANLNLLGIIDDTQLADITAGNIGVVSVAVLDSADGDMRISLLAREQLQVLAELAGNTANLADAGDRKFADTITRDCVKI
jgi:hypothetical protein